MADGGNTFFLRHQPLKAVYLAYVAATLVFVRLPCWFMLALVPWLRPRASWTIGRTLLVKTLQVVVPAVFSTASFDSVRVDPHTFMRAEDAAGLVWIDAAPELVVGDVKKFAKLNKVDAVHVPAYWFGERDTVTGLADQRALPDGKIILNFHSGGWVIGDAAPTGLSAGFCKDMLGRFPQFSRLLNVEYRLSQGHPFPIQNPFPAALIDAVTAYNHLVHDLHFQPRNILVTGDSAGATLAFQLVLYLVSGALPSLAVPGGLLLLSPSLDWGTSHHGGGAFARNASSDWVAAFNAGYCTRALLGRLPRSEADVNAWLSAGGLSVPARPGTYAGFPPTLFFAGAAEMTLDAMKVAARRVAADAGKDRVEFIEQADATHIVLGLPWHEQEKEQGYHLIAEWIERQF